MRAEVPAVAGSRSSIDRDVRLIADDGSGGRDDAPWPGRRNRDADDDKWTMRSRGRERRASAARLHARVQLTLSGE